MSNRRASGLNVAFVVTSLHGGGAEFVGRTWMAWLAERGHRVLAITTSTKPTDEYLPAGVELWPVGNAGSHLARVRSLRGLLYDNRVDVVIAMQSYANLVALAAVRMMLPGRGRPRIIVSERNLVSLALPGALSKQRLKHLITTRAYRLADHLIAISHPVAGEMVSGFGVSGRRLTVVPNPATAKVTLDDQPTRRPGGSGIDIELVVATRLVPQKRPELAVLVAKALSDRGVRTKLTYFGTGPLADQLTARSAALGVDLDLRGWVEAWYRECSQRAVFLLTSDHEGFGNVLVEAAAVGVPSVALSGALGVADAVIPGITGELALDDQPETIADAVQRAAGIGEVTGVERWLERFSYAGSGRALEHVLGRVTGSRVR